VTRNRRYAGGEAVRRCYQLPLQEAFLKACFHDLIEGIGPGPEGSRLTLNNYRSWGSGVEDRLWTIGGYAMQRLFGVSVTLFIRNIIKRKVLNIDG